MAYIDLPVGPPQVFRFPFDNGAGGNMSPGEMYNGCWDDFTYSGNGGDIFWPGIELVPGWPAVVGRIRPTSATDATGQNQRAACARIPHNILTTWGAGNKYLAQDATNNAGAPYWLSFAIKTNAAWEVARPTLNGWQNWGYLANGHSFTATATSPWAVGIATKTWVPMGVAPDTSVGADPTPTGSTLTPAKLCLDIAGGTFRGTLGGYVRAISHFFLADFVPGHLYFIDLGITPSPDPTVGKVECWVDGVQVLAPTLCRTAFCSGALGTTIEGTYLHFENYRPSPTQGGYSISGTNDLYACGCRLGDTRAETTFWQGSTAP